MVSPATRTDRKLPDGRLAFYQERPDDCLRPCIATVLQVPGERCSGVLTPADAMGDTERDGTRRLHR
jgi:hypothetical protein